MDLPSDAPTLEDWRAATDERFLKGRDFETLVRRTEDGVARGPLFTAADRSAHAALSRHPSSQREGRPWHILAPVRDGDLAFANAQLLRDLEGGASGARFADLPLDDRADVGRLFEGVHTDLIPLVFAPGSRNGEVAQRLVDMPRFTEAEVTLGLDIAEVDGPAALDAFPSHWRAITIAAARFHELGAGPVLELATLAATLAEACRKLGPEVAARRVAVEIAADQDAHIGIAKARAARRLIARIFDAFDHAAMLPIHAVTSLRMMQADDPWTDLLRTTNAAFGAVIGGADSVTVRPITETLGPDTPFTHRLARNIQILMMEESHLGTVSDPAFGSYFHEALTDPIAHAAWSIFQKIETEGGLASYTTSGMLAARLDIDKDGRSKAPIVGVTLHPRPDDVPLPEVRR